MEGRVPGVSGVDERRAMDRVQEQRPRSRAALGPGDWESQIEVEDGGTRADDVLGREAAQQADGVAAEVEHRVGRAWSGGGKYAARTHVAPGTGNGGAGREDRVRTKDAAERADVEHGSARVHIRSESGAT